MKAVLGGLPSDSQCGANWCGVASTRPRAQVAIAPRTAGGVNQMSLSGYCSNPILGIAVAHQDYC